MNLYGILCIDENATKEDIKKAYKKLALKYHPDKNSHDEKNAQNEFIKVTQAYQILYNDISRKQYDQNGDIHYNKHLSCEDLFNTIFKDADPKLSKFIYTTYEKINEAVDASNSGNILEIYENIDKKNILLNGAELLADYVIGTYTSKPPDDNSVFNISNLNVNEVFKIELSLGDYLNKEFYKISIIDEKKSKTYPIKLKTEYNSQNIQINNNTYYFELIDTLHTLYKRVNSYDLYSSIDIGIEDYFDGFCLHLDYFDKNIEFNIQLSINKSFIIKIENYGLPIWSEDKQGDLYISFHLTRCNRLHSPILSNHIDKSINMFQLIDTISIY